MESSKILEKKWAVDSTDLPGGEGSSSQQQSNSDLCSGGIGLIEIESSLPSQQQTSTCATLQTSSEEKFNAGIVSPIHLMEKYDVNVTLTHLGEKSNTSVIEDEEQSRTNITSKKVI
jgi:hypothetical protein